MFGKQRSTNIAPKRPDDDFRTVASYVDTRDTLHSDNKNRSIQLCIPKSSSVRTYKILTKIEGLGKDRMKTEFYDIKTGELLMSTPGNRDPVKNIIAYDTKDGKITPPLTQVVRLSQVKSKEI